MDVVVCAGETSGDVLAAGLIAKLKQRFPDAKFYGIAGPKMVAAGCVAWHDIEELSVMGFVDVIKQLPRLLQLRRQLVKKTLAIKPELYIGVDAPDFNLPIERRLKQAGVKTVHYVSPTVWAWRGGRIHGIKKAVDLMLIIFPFEQEIYNSHQIPVCFVGHPRAQVLAQVPSKTDARQQLGLPEAAHYFALLPGSRHMEVAMLAPVFLATMAKFAGQGMDFVAVIPAANANLGKMLQQQLANFPELAMKVVIVPQQVELALAAADLVLTVAGTSTLEAMLVGRPMVVAYRLSALNWLLCRWLVKVKYCSLPNLLANQALVPEFLQDDVMPDKLCAALQHWLDNPEQIQQLLKRFAAISETLRLDADERAAAAVAKLLELCT